MSKFCLNPACRNPRNQDQNKFCHGCGSNLAESTQSYQFDYYRVTKLLGQGGFGRTYLAEYSRRYNQPRVIKTLITRENEENQQKIKELFAREAEQLCNLDHPQIPKLYEYFERDNNLYLVQEFIDGMSLSEEFEQQGAFDEQKIQNIVEELLPVLAYIEEQNILHRDIKPDNIMRRRSDGQLMLIDFGAARVKTGRDPSILTAIYTPGYAAIEHMMGRPVKASDVYSLGVTCTRLLTGCFYDGTTDPIYDDHNNCLCWKEYLQERNIKVNDRLAAILDKMVASSLRDRYPNAQTVLEDLLLHSSPPVLLPTGVKTRQNPTVSLTFSEPSRTFIKSSKRVGLIAGVAAILTGVVGIGGYLLINLLINQPETRSRNKDNYNITITTKEIDNINDNTNSIEKNDISPLLKSLKVQYQERNYQECYQLATDNPHQDNSEVQEWIGKCGLEAAKIKANANSYSGAISIAKTIPNTVPNYQEVKDSINNWSVIILDYATKIYQQGKLKEAIKITENIPENSNLTAVVPELISQWQQEEAKYQNIINNAQNLLNQEQWDAAKKEVEKIPTDFVFWRQKSQPILNEANQQINVIAVAAEKLRLEEKRKREQEAAAVAAEKLRLEKEKLKREQAAVAAEKLRLEEEKLKREQAAVAAEKLRLEEEKRKKEQEAAEKLRQEEERNRSSLISKATGVNYNLLQDLLEARKWKDADQETTRMMIQAAGREKEGWFRREDINKFSCEDLRIIDQLWLESSQGKFGFSVQKEIWQRNRSPGYINKRDWRKFYIDVGWKIEESGDRSKEGYVRYEDLGGFKDLTTSRTGNLPATNRFDLVISPVGFHRVYLLARRAAKCNL